MMHDLLRRLAERLGQRRTRSPRANPGRFVPVVVGALAIAATIASPAAAAGDPGATGWARFGHFAPSATAVDVLVDGEPFATEIDFKRVTDYRELPAGVHRFELRASADPDGPALLSIDADVPADGAVTVTAVTTRDGVAPQVFDDALLTPEAGQSLVRFIHAAPDSAAVDIAIVDGPALASDVPYPEATEYRDVAPGSYDVVVSDAETEEAVLRVDGWRIEPGVQATIAIVAGQDGMLDVAPIVDAVAVADAPQGGVQTGYGGMADSAPATGLPIATILALVVGVLAVGESIRRRRAAIATVPTR